MLSFCLYLRFDSALAFWGVNIWFLWLYFPCYFVVELKKQSSCSVRLVNKTNQHVAFKVQMNSCLYWCLMYHCTYYMELTLMKLTTVLAGENNISKKILCSTKHRCIESTSNMYLYRYLVFVDVSSILVSAIFPSE